MKVINKEEKEKSVLKKIEKKTELREFSEIEKKERGTNSIDCRFKSAENSS